MYSQGPQNHPPQPKSQNAKAPDLPCGRGVNGNGPGNGGGGNGNIPPPVGLCLPINDYLMPLLLAGIFLGGYKVWTIEKAA